VSYVVALDLLERRWHTGALAAMLSGSEPEEWDTVRARFDAWLDSEVEPLTEEQEKLHLLGLR
jgi:hypothetical protein